MGIKLAGKPVVESLREDIKLRVSALGEKQITPTLLLIRVGAREDDIWYERSILKNCDLLGIQCQVKELPLDVSMEELRQVFHEENHNPHVHGIMIFRPLPEQLDPEEIRNLIDPAKDIDCMSPVNLEKVFEGNSDGFAPCTPKAVIELLKHYEIPLKGANVTVAGRSLVVGKPLAMLLLDEHATVTICHSRTQDMPSVTRQADVVVAAIGKAKFMTEEYFGEGQIVVDVGINDDGTGKIVGDVDYDAAFEKVKAITPATGGIGLITTTILLNHVVQACENITNDNKEHSQV
ncbi:bifunctional 5,10-methylenetetrahydrofolate dehydrogenase/5,10-methenyltetrahydrofolate cyclohydrolase [Niallia endozanthoxylica]|uniref:Bifunctional protein FolD n=1 Tax=Niallia endozanthoxylica TaxID=2036016 RepID=A0A5J5H0C7_9BACI|nr:bifunctional 5,10-methylenetetrahydrofolate dehydrogenase/5,10-methenyltetrahydrofolate cyclohydrolase [Niallia endozanthoxylica]KAA9014059.1 bifunctional 5,10-methylenetetrahydrofolate dehydrogenase/5,10-methenyltetrahydrofolate cyclohydrolase [Niallia endozanthoxylica]